MSTPVRLESQQSVFEPLEPRLLLSGTSYLVDSLADTVASDGVITLREAIQAANTNAAVYDAPAGSSTDVDVITFDQAALEAEAGPGNPLVITLGGTQLEITDDLEIQGLGQDVLTIDANGLSRVLYVSGADTDVELSDLKITGGYADWAWGGGIYVEAADLALTDAAVSGNWSMYGGGGIYNTAGATLSLTNGTVSSNTSQGYNGGGIYNAGEVTLTDSALTANAADEAGGGLFNYAGTATFSNTTVSSNTASYGAGISNPWDGAIVFTGSSVSDNAAEEDGGGIYLRNGSLTLTDTSVSDNCANDGGGLYSMEATATMTGATFSGNTAAAYGGAIYSYDGTITLHGATLSDNSAEAQGGGGIYNEGADLSIDASTISGNSARYGGGVLHDNSTRINMMFLTNTTLSDNSAESFGGGVYVKSEAEIRNVTVSGNSAYDGGGFYLSHDTSIVNATVTGNHAVEEGGGIASNAWHGLVELVNVSVTGNSADERGGGIHTFLGTLTLTNSVVSGNSALEGGGIFVDYRPFILTNSTVAGNWATRRGGGIFNEAELTLNNSIVAVNDAPVVPDIEGSFIDNSSLVGGDPGFVANPSAGTDGTWGTPDDEAGDLRLSETSPAVDMGDIDLLPADLFDLNDNGDTTEKLPVDLDGNPRVRHVFVDVGAYESPYGTGTAYMVNSLRDVVASDGRLTLREAIQAANTNLPVNEAAAGMADETDTISFDQVALEAEAGPGNPLTIVLGGTQLDITDDLTIYGLGQTVLTIDAGGLSRVLQVSGAPTEIELNDLTITGGATMTDGGGIYTEGLLTLQSVSVSDSHADEDGGGIYNGGTLTLTDSIVSGNSGNRGAGVFNAGGILDLSSTVVADNWTTGSDANGAGISSRYGTLTLTDTTLSNNSTDGVGGGINSYQDTLTVTDATLTGNSAMAGGGVWSATGELTLENTTVSNNSATGPGSNGGGIYSALATLIVTDSTVSDNTTEGSGGGIYAYETTLVLMKSTVSMNVANRGGALYVVSGSGKLTNAELLGNTADEAGGGIFSDAGTLTLVNVAAVGNTAVGEGGGIYNGTGALTLDNSTISGNGANQGGGIFNAVGTLTLNNTIVALNDAAVSGDIAGDLAENNSLVSVDPAFLRNPSAGVDGVWGTEDDDYGNLRPLPTGPARDAGDNALLPVDEFDLDSDGNVTEPLPVDLAGGPRIRGGIVDIGAYESPRPGDANADGKVDGTDIALWAQNYDPLGHYAPHAWGEGDWNQDGKVDGTDFALWQRNYDPLGPGGDEPGLLETSAAGGDSPPAQNVGVLSITGPDLQGIVEDSDVGVRLDDPRPLALAAATPLRIEVDLLATAGTDDTPVPGDANHDGRVDGTDLAIWQQNYDPLGTQQNTFEMGDWNGDGKVDGTDLALW